MQRTDSLEKTLMLGKIEGRRGRGRQRMRWLNDHRLDGHEFEQCLGVGDGQGSLVCCSPWVAKSWTQLSNWTELNTAFCLYVRISVRYILKSETAGSKCMGIYNLADIAKFPSLGKVLFCIWTSYAWAAYICDSPTRLLSHGLSKYVISLLNFCQSDRWEMQPQCGLGLHSLFISEVEHFFICLRAICIAFSESYMHAFQHFSAEIFCINCWSLTS